MRLLDGFRLDESNIPHNYAGDIAIIYDHLVLYVQLS